MKFKSLLICSLAIASLASAVQAQEVTFAGTTTGTFSLTGTNTNGGITFNGQSFSNTTLNGFAGFVLGNFNITGPVAITDGQTFTLRVTFTAPPGTGPNPGVFTANLSGALSSTAGGVMFNFVNDASNPQVFTFAGGTFRFFVDDLTLRPGVTNVDLTGGAFAQVPEGGSTVALLGMALVAAAAVRRRLAI